MSHRAMNLVWEHGPAQHSHLVLLLRIADNVNDVTGEWGLSQDFLARHTRLSVRQVQRIVKLLERDAWLECRRDAGKAIVYRLGSRFGQDVTPDKMSPLTSSPQGGDISAPETGPGGDTTCRVGATPDVAHTVSYPQDLTGNSSTSAEPRGGSTPQVSRQAPERPGLKFEGEGLVVLEIPLVTRADPVFRVRASLLPGWREAYPAVEAGGMDGRRGIERELAAIREWNLAHPKNQKTRDGMLRHLTGWLAKAQNSASRSEKRVPAASRGAKGAAAHEYFAGEAARARAGGGTAPGAAGGAGSAGGADGGVSDGSQSGAPADGVRARPGRPDG